MHLSIKTHIFRVRYLIALLLFLMFWIGGGSEARAKVVRDSGNVYWVDLPIDWYAEYDDGDNYGGCDIYYAEDGDWRGTPELVYDNGQRKGDVYGYAYFLSEYYDQLYQKYLYIPVPPHAAITSSTRSGNKWVITSKLQKYSARPSSNSDYYLTVENQMLILLYDNETIYDQAINLYQYWNCNVYLGIQKKNNSTTSQYLSGPMRDSTTVYWEPSTDQVSTEYHRGWKQGRQDKTTGLQVFKQDEYDSSTGGRTCTYTLLNVPKNLTSVVAISWRTQTIDYRGHYYVKVTQMQEIGTRTGNTNYPQVYSGFTVKYDYNGGSGSSSSVENTTKVTLPSPSRTGYDFAGWYSDDKTRVGGSGGSYNVTQNVTLKAHWTPHTYTVTYHGNGGTGSPDGQKDSLTYDSSGSLRGNTLQRAYTITYQTNLGDTFSKNVTGVTDGQKDTSTYSTIGWSQTKGDPNNPDSVDKQYDFNQSKPNLTATNNANVDLYAVWRTQSKTLPTPARHGYTFTGWYDSAGNKIGDGGASYIPRQNITLYAHWSPITYHAYYNLYGGSYGGSAEGKAFTVENAFKLDAPTLNGYTFLGWIGGTDPQDNGAWGMENPKTSTQAAKSVTVPAGTYGDVFFRAIFEKNHSVDEDGNNTDDVYVAHSKPQETKY